MDLLERPSVSPPCVHSFPGCCPTALWPLKDQSPAETPDGNSDNTSRSGSRVGGRRIRAPSYCSRPRHQEADWYPTSAYAHSMNRHGVRTAHLALPYPAIRVAESTLALSEWMPVDAIEACGSRSSLPGVVRCTQRRCTRCDWLAWYLALSPSVLSMNSSSGM
jgi:hypothetical protein